MPFDGTTYNRRRRLSYAQLSRRLRAHDFPEGFEWDFIDCWSCAMGLALSLKHGQVMTHNLLSQLTGDFTGDAVKMYLTDGKRMNHMVFERIFWSIRGKPVLDHKDVTPEMVADQIDAWLAEQKASRRLSRAKVTA